MTNNDNVIIKKGLQLLSATNPYLYNVLVHHRTHQNQKIDFKNRSFLVPIYLDKSPKMVIVKSTQCGISEFLISFVIDQAIKNRNVIYTSPNELIRSRFVFGRFNKTVEYTKLYSDAMKKVDSVNLKEFNAIVNFIGSNSTSGFTEFVAKTIVVDEYDECAIANIPMLQERMSDTIPEERKQILVGNPTIEGFGIDDEYSRSDKKKWLIKHDCNEWVKLDFFKHVVEEKDKDIYVLKDKEYETGMKRDIYAMCPNCQKPMDRFIDGEWVKEDSHSDISGYQISKMFSTKATMKELVDRLSLGLKNPEVLQRLYNGDLGEANTASGAKITTLMLDAIAGAHRNKSPQSDGYGIMGIDVGNKLNVIIGYLLPDYKIKVSYVGEIPADIEELKKLIIEYNVKAGVIDAFPEQHFVSKVKNSFKNFLACYYQESKKEPVDTSRNVTVNRTSSLDAIQEHILTGNFILPADAKNIPNFYSHMTASTRVWDPKKNNERGLYVWVHSKEDHYHHALNYLAIARKFALAMQRK